jgi:glycosyltransferase involved in cell wall biosynthesis
MAYKILFVLRALDVGGGQINTVNLSKRLIERGHRVCIMADQGPLYPFLEKNGIQYIPTPFEKRKHPNYHQFMDYYKALKPGNYDIIVNIETHEGLILETYLCAYLLKVPILQTYFGNWLGSEYWPQTWPIVTNKPYMVEEFKDIGWETQKLLLWMKRIIPFPVRNTKGRDYFMERYFIKTETATLVCVGRLDTFRNYGYLDLFFRTCEIINTSSPKNIQAIVVGGGPSAEYFNEWAQRINQSRSRCTMIMTGELADASPAYEIDGIHFGRASALLRAMSYDHCCIAIGNNYFAPVDPENYNTLVYYEFTRNLHPNKEIPKLMADKILQLINAPAEMSRLGAFAGSMVRKDFNIEEGVVEFESIIKSTIDRQRPSGIKQIIEISVLIASIVKNRIIRRLGFKLKNKPSRQGLPFSNN